jgi:predicted  nucleic acid-binding Zn-ribbon protein
MNREIEIMIELQDYWHRLLRGQADIERSEKSILSWNDELESKSNALLSLEDEIKNEKSRLKQGELDLYEKDEHYKRLEERKMMIKTEKEMRALDSELQRVNEERDILENEIIGLLDELERRERELTEMRSDLENFSKQVDGDIERVQSRIEQLRVEISENQKKFEQLLPELSAGVRTRFKKLIESGSGEAIAALEGKDCGGCHFRLPEHELLDASRDDKIINCTNCGRFVYKR